MRAIKVLMVTVTMTASMVVGLATTADAAAPKHVSPSSLWCC